MTILKCDSCNQDLKPYERTILCGFGKGEKDQHLCDRCMNAWMSETGKIDFQHPEFMPLTMQDARGKDHLFNFRAQLHSTGLGIEAFEMKDGERHGYEFSVLDEHEADPMVVFKRLYEKMKRALARRHVLRKKELTVGWSFKGMTIRGNLDYDPRSKDRLPLITIDGRPFSWRKFGQILMMYEGHQFRLEMLDKSDEA